MKRTAKHVVSDEAAVIQAMERIRDGRKVSVSYVQRGLSVATVVGRWVPRNPPVRIGWMVFGSGESVACILPTDRVVMFSGPSGTMHLRVELSGRRIAQSVAMVRRARIAGILPKLIEDGPAGGAA